MLEMRSVTKTYLHRGDTVVAMDRISLQIAPGEYLAVVGASGSGKSTLLLTLGGMLSPSAGEVWVGSQSSYALPSGQRALLRRKNIGFVFQSFNLVPYLNALENVQLPLFLAGAGDDAQRSIATALLARVGLSDRLNHKPSELSVGQMQRVALARMLANDPPVILADEPTGNLDPQTAEMVLDFLQDLNREGRTIVMVTHDMQAAGRASRVIRLVAGAVASDSAALPRAATNW